MSVFLKLKLDKLFEFLNIFLIKKFFKIYWKLLFDNNFVINKFVDLELIEFFNFGVYLIIKFEINFFVLFNESIFFIRLIVFELFCKIDVLVKINLINFDVVLIFFNLFLLILRRVEINELVVFENLELFRILLNNEINFFLEIILLSLFLDVLYIFCVINFDRLLFLLK